MSDVTKDIKITVDEPVELVVVAVKKIALRCRVIPSGEPITFRVGPRDELEGEIVTVKPSKIWRHKTTHYISGDIISKRMDIPAIGLQPLTLTEMYPWDPKEEYWGEPDEPVNVYCRPIIDYGIRQSYEMEQLVPFEDPEDFESTPILETVDFYFSGNIEKALKIMEHLLAADLRCLDAHAHLGNWDFDRADKGSAFFIERAKRHYEVGVKIGELSFDKEFKGELPWGHIDNRPYLRCLHGYGLCLWRLNQDNEAREVFEKMLWLNPLDNQGVRFLLADIDAGKTWEEAYKDERNG